MVCGADVATLFCIEIANGPRVAAATTLTFATYSMPFASFSTLLIRQLTDLLQIENKSANSERESEKGSVCERERGRNVSEFENSFCMLRPELCNKNRDPQRICAISWKLFTCLYEIETTNTIHTRGHTHTYTDTRTHSHAYCRPYKRRKFT